MAAAVLSKLNWSHNTYIQLSSGLHEIEELKYSFAVDFSVCVCVCVHNWDYFSDVVSSARV